MGGLSQSRSALSIRLMASVVFFFQAEDGIRDVAVTGVQTCALPISSLADEFEALRSKANCLSPSVLRPELQLWENLTVNSESAADIALDINVVFLPRLDTGARRPAPRFRYHQQIVSARCPANQAPLLGFI